MPPRLWAEMIRPFRIVPACPCCASGKTRERLWWGVGTGGIESRLGLASNSVADKQNSCSCSALPLTLVKARLCLFKLVAVVDVHLHAFQSLASNNRAKNLVQVRRHGAIRGAVKVFLGRLQRPAENGLLLQAKRQGSTTDLVGEWQSLGTAFPVSVIGSRDLSVP